MMITVIFKHSLFEEFLYHHSSSARAFALARVNGKFVSYWFWWFLQNVHSRGH